jgi:hypothetical protein
MTAVGSTGGFFAATDKLITRAITKLKTKTNPIFLLCINSSPIELYEYDQKLE